MERGYKYIKSKLVGKTYDFAFDLTKTYVTKLSADGFTPTTSLIVLAGLCPQVFPQFANERTLANIQKQIGAPIHEPVESDNKSVLLAQGFRFYQDICNASASEYKKWDIRRNPLLVGLFGVIEATAVKKLGAKNAKKHHLWGGDDQHWSGWVGGTDIQPMFPEHPLSIAEEQEQERQREADRLDFEEKQRESTERWRQEQAERARSEREEADRKAQKQAEKEARRAEKQARREASDNFPLPRSYNAGPNAAGQPSHLQGHRSKGEPDTTAIPAAKREFGEQERKTEITNRSWFW